MRLKKQYAVIMDNDKLVKFAKKISNKNQAVKKTSIKLLLKRGILQLNKINETYTEAMLASKAGKVLPQQFEWLCDNLFIIQRELKSSILNLRNIKNMPAIINKNNKKTPFSYYLAQEFCYAMNFDIRIGQVVLFLKNVQDERSLENDEIWVFPEMLRLAIISGIYSACTEMDEILLKNDIGENDLGLYDHLRLTMANAITSLRKMNDLNLKDHFHEISATEKILNSDPSGVYPNVSEDTKIFYRRLLTRLAKANKISEKEAAAKYFEMAKNSKAQRYKHIGTHLFNEITNRKKALRVMYFSYLFTLPVILSLITGIVFNSVLLAVLLFLPYWEIVKSVLEFFITKLLIGTYLPRMDFEKGIPSENKTAIAISTIFGGAKSVLSYEKKLEKLYLSNRDENLVFGIIADLKESKTEIAEEDYTVNETAVKMIERLNAKYPDKFFLFIRKRVFNSGQNKYIGWEKKRGVILELVRFIKDEETTFSTIGGNFAEVKNSKYVITLDSDTNLSINGARELISVIAHPLNAPEIDKEKGIVKNGYGILQPKMTVDLNSANKSAFSRIFSGFGGVETYNNTSFDIYQDLFDEGIFAGKGIFDVNAFYTLLDNAFPENIILSHDLLEGSFLRAGYISDISLTDSHPTSFLSFFERLHRWTRGDWQLLFALKKRYKIEKDNIKTNPISLLSKWKITDNLRRSINAPVYLLALILSVFMPSKTALIIFIVIISSHFFGFILNFLDLLYHGKFFSISLRYYSQTIPPILQGLYKSIFSIMLIPYSAYISFDAIFRSLWRQFVSKKRLLSWVTAEQADNSKKIIKTTSSFKKMWFSIITGFLFLLFVKPFLIICGGLWILIVPLTHMLGKEVNENNKIKMQKEQREELLKYAKDMWGYYDEFMNEENSFLPPDNFQESPLSGVANRTSPTNIGLALLCCLSARDFDFINTNDMVDRIKKSLLTVKQMQKFKGHLFNWYNTINLVPLMPKYVSTVDSGNLICSLIALKEGLKEYVNENSDILALIQIIDELINETDFLMLYDKEKKLFHIEYDIEKNTYGEGYYDFFMSEARLTSYFAISKGIVPKKHWFSLSRMMSVDKGHFGFKSWTGTMFEYYMPHLLLPVYNNTSIYEALRYAVEMHKKRVKKLHAPWGISEGCFYAFDSSLHYQYKAFGVQKLGLKQGLDNELVISPYSTFLVINMDYKKAYKNLKRLFDLGAYGKFGFYESVDFTKSRIGVDYTIVKSYMAHHIGMSLIALSNLFFENNMQERFLNDPEMMSSQELLQEKLPSDTFVYDETFVPEVPENALRRHANTKVTVSEINPQSPKLMALSNGSFVSLISDSGLGFSKWNKVNITRYRKELIENTKGVFFMVQNGKYTMSLTKAPIFDNKVLYKAEFTNCQAMFYSQMNDIETKMKVAVHGSLPCEIREIRIRNNAYKKVDLTLLAYLEPILAEHKSEIMHPAFSGLFIESEFDNEHNVILFNRRKREKTDDEIWLCVGFTNNLDDLHTETRREIVLDRFTGTSLLNNAFDNNFTGVKDACIDPCAAFKTTFSLNPREGKNFEFCICSGTSRSEALNNFITVKNDNYTSILKNSSSVINNLRSLSGVSEAEILTEELLLPRIFYNTADNQNNNEIRDKNNLSLKELWKYGVSGDYPIILIRIYESDDIIKEYSTIRAFMLLRRKSIPCELVFLFREGGQYDRIIYNSIKDAVKTCKAEYLLETKQGIHLVNIQSADDINLFYAFASYISDYKNPSNGNQITRKLNIQNIRKTQSSTAEYMVVKDTACGGFVDNGFLIKDKKIMNQRPPWCHILANPKFGTVISDSSLGYTYAINASENKLTPWTNDPVNDNRGERLYIKINEKIYDICSGGETAYYPGYAVYTSKASDIELTTTVFVPTNEKAKIVKVSLKNLSENNFQVQLCYYIEPVMGTNRETNENFLKCKYNDGVIYINNPFNYNYKNGTAFLTSTNRPSFYGFDKINFLEGKWKENPYIGSNICAFLGEKKHIGGNTEEEIIFIFGYGRNTQEAVETTERLKNKTYLENVFNNTIRRYNDFTDSVELKTPDSSINVFVNSLLSYQVLISRIYARTAFYQCSGAFGFRDQLQDCMSLCIIKPELLKRQIIRSCLHQFEEGDVMHWWHTVPGKHNPDSGVRTRCSDDLLWLPLAVSEYIEKTGDNSFLNLKLKYLKAPILKEDEQTRYFNPERTDYSESVYLHCIKSINKGITKGRHSLLLFGDGDWNDSMNAVGIDGRGESVWLSMFASLVLNKFSKICEIMSDDELAEKYIIQSKELVNAVEHNAWDGDWYMRGYFDNGDPLGSRNSEECQIDLLPQSFASIIEGFDNERKTKALESAENILFDKEIKIIKLLSPPFKNARNNPGYIKGYLAGIRENGGQYTHAAIWYALAQIQNGNPDKGFEALSSLNPVNRTSSVKESKVYRLEPYVIAADIYSNPSCKGRGGWSWYTGAAGWYYRVVIEYMLGIKRNGNAILIKPKLPKSWNGYEVNINIEKTNIALKVEKGDKNELIVDGQKADFIPLDGAKHKAKAIYKK